ncbi:hypothetical protein OC844_007818, partial [Tilletia horrida]
MQSKIALSATVLILAAQLAAGAPSKTTVTNIENNGAIDVAGAQVGVDLLKR